jgi:hypothetical protein
MPSTAITAQRSVLKVTTATAATKAITAATKANPCVVTATAHGYATGDIIQIDAVGGMIELNGRAYVITVLTADTFGLNGVNSLAYTTYTSGGTAAKKTQTAVGNIKDFNINPDAATEIEVTNLASTRKEYRLGLAGSWVITCAMDIDSADVGQLELAAAQDDGFSRVFTVTLSNGKIFAGVGFVRSFSAAGSADAVVGGQLDVRGTGQPTWFA